MPQGLAESAGSAVTISFTPHLMPFSRGMEADIYVKLAGGATADSLREALAARYADEPFVSVLPKVCFDTSVARVGPRLRLCPVLSAQLASV